MPRVRSFPPVENSRARVLILGSMPGVASLAAGQYYAHAQNRFWPIVCELLGAKGMPSYAARVRLLLAHRIALWDVLESCVREGSLDSAIDDASAKANDFGAFFRTHPRVVRILFNGAKAEAAWRRQVRPGLETRAANIETLRLPSTSPAHAALAYAGKRLAWQAGLAAIL